MGLTSLRIALIGQIIITDHQDQKHKRKRRSIKLDSSKRSCNLGILKSNHEAFTCQTQKVKQMRHQTTSCLVLREKLPNSHGNSKILAGQAARITNKINLQNAHTVSVLPKRSHQRIYGCGELRMRLLAQNRRIAMRSRCIREMNSRVWTRAAKKWRSKKAAQIRAIRKIGFH